MDLWANCLAKKVKRSFKCLRGCSWQVLPKISETSRPFLGNKMPCCDTMYTFDYIGTNCCVQILETSKYLQGSSWRAAPAISGGSEPWEWHPMPSYDKVYMHDNCWLVHNLLTSNIKRILHASWRMQLTSCSNILWELWTIWMTCHALLKHNILNWQLETGKQVVELKYGKDPSSIFQDAVDGLFQQSLSTLNLEND